MKTNDKAPLPTPAAKPAGAAARGLVRTAMKGALATLDRSSGHPYASLVSVATLADATPVLLLSRLALHTQNLLADPRASLLVEPAEGGGDPLATGRVTVIGRLVATTDEAARRRYLARHPDAEGYADFPDFAFYRLEIERAHFVAGFGRIAPLQREEIVADVADAAALMTAESDIVNHMNEDHAAAVESYATVIAGAPSGPWRMVGLDPEGCDLVCPGAPARRIEFATRVHNPDEARQELVRLATKARGR